MSPFKVVLSAAFLALAACSAPQSGSVLQAPQDAIIGGQEVTAESPLLTSIVGIYDHSIGAICTGSLLPNNVVLTAAHCIGEDNSKLFIIFGTDILKVITSEDENVIRQNVRAVTSTKVHSGWKGENQTTNWDWNDIALIKFRGAIPAGFKPVRLLTDRASLTAGAAVTMAGYGVSKVTIEQVDPKTLPDIEKSISEGEVMCSPNRAQCIRLDASGDGPLRFVEQTVSYVLANEVAISQKDGRGTCSGDSGGPAYVKKDGEYYLWGITSRGDAACNQMGIYTFATSYLDWINKESSNMK